MGRHGKAGMRSGEAFGQTVKAGDRHVINKQYIPLKNFTTGTGITNAANVGVLSGAAVMAWVNTIRTKGSTTIMTPSNIRPNTKAEVNVYWATSSGVPTALGVVWELDYRAVSVVKSGAIAVTGLNYITSGAHSNVTATHVVVSGAVIADNITKLQKTTLTIPATDIDPESLLILNLFRDVDETADTSLNTANVVSVEVEYVDG